MSSHNEIAYSTADGNDYAEHESTYVFFTKLVKFGTTAVIIVLILMAFFLV
ncbi:MAG: aa3-type cytochrome c oxidase subunit IV [Xanthobacteraceae bacterium]|nr:aa3-type cytochrome c oxidase subunit IV [Xanthobacteraceae bacterium]